MQGKATMIQRVHITGESSGYVRYEEVGNNEVPVVVSKLGVVGSTSRERGGLNSTLRRLTT